MEIIEEQKPRYIIKDKNTEVGFLNFYKKDCFLKSIKIYPEYRNKGYGKNAVKKILEEEDKLRVSRLKSKKMKGILTDLSFKKIEGKTEENNFRYFWEKK